MSQNTLLHPSTWTLRAKLVAAIVALFLGITLTTSAATALLTRKYLLDQLDASVVATAQRAIGGGPAGGTRGRGGPIPGNGDATLRLLLDNGEVDTDPSGQAVSTAVNRAGDPVTLTDTQIRLLEGANLGARPTTVDLGPDLGTYRLVQVTTSNNHQFITGIPTSSLEDILERVVVLITGGTLVGLVLVAAGGTVLIRRNLQPLERVAGTARRVSNLKLDSGEVALAERVGPADVDPRTEVGQVGLALNRMLDNVEGALQARHESEMRVRQFVADASHELRTPLASIRGYAELSRREVEPVPPSVTHALGRVESEALRMTSLVEDLLLLARLDEGRPLDRAEVDLSMLAINAVSDAHAASPGHNWQLDLPDEPITVMGDEARLHQVLTNLLANARVHTPDGTTVVTRIRQHDKAVRLSVTDNGPGIPAELQPTVFGRFTRGDDSRSRAAGSTGLGLSIVAAVAGAHGGRVGLSSKPGETSFVVELPAA